MTSYNKRVKERDEALNEVYELKKLMRDFIINKSRTDEVISIVAEFQVGEDIEALLWFGDSTNNKNF